ncbi:unnamed protein product, partial [Mesorhabditis belari]|uniref:Uncharacterized protein n=1 Tax=Mesorhabditis belari TaxID=2138241 RepID=A0AAF3F3E8_9BILA
MTENNEERPVSYFLEITKDETATRTGPIVPSYDNVVSGVTSGEPPVYTLSDQSVPYNVDLPPSYEMEHRCALTTESWPIVGKRKKVIYTCALIGLPLPPLINIAGLCIILSDIHSNPVQYESNAESLVRVGIGVDVFLGCMMLLCVVLGLIGIFKKKPIALQVMTYILVFLAGLYAYTGVYSMFVLDVLGIVIAIGMVIWLSALVFLTRLHQRRMFLCMKCY